MSDINSTPVTLPAGSYDYDALKRETDKAAKGPASKYEENIEKATEAARVSTFEKVDPRGTPGYVLKEVERPDLGVTERIQVYDPKKEDEALEAQAEGEIPVPQDSNQTAAAPAKASKE